MLTKNIVVRSHDSFDLYIQASWLIGVLCLFLIGHVRGTSIVTLRNGRSFTHVTHRTIHLALANRSSSKIDRCPNQAQRSVGRSDCVHALCQRSAYPFGSTHGPTHAFWATRSSVELWRVGRNRARRFGQRVTWSVCASCQQCERCLLEIPQKCTRLFKYGQQPGSRSVRADWRTTCCCDRALQSPRCPTRSPIWWRPPQTVSTATVAGMIRAVGTPFGSASAF